MCVWAGTGVRDEPEKVLAALHTNVSPTDLHTSEEKVCVCVCLYARQEKWCLMCRCICEGDSGRGVDLCQASQHGGRGGRGWGMSERLRHVCECAVWFFYFLPKTRVTVVPVRVDTQTVICSGPLVVNIIQCSFLKEATVLNVALPAAFINQPSCVVLTWFLILLTLIWTQSAITKPQTWESAPLCLWLVFQVILDCVLWSVTQNTCAHLVLLLSE